MATVKLSDKYRERFAIKSPLRGYQRRACLVGTQNDNYALLMDPRLGKTRIDVAVAGYRRKVNGIKRWVIICPAIAMQVWADEIAQTLDLPYQLEIVEGKAAERKALLKEWVDDPAKLSIVIMNHEATWRIKKFLYKFNPDKITVDESHKIKNHSAKQSRTIHTLGKRAKYHSILTGTLMSTPMDVFSQYKFLQPSIFGENWKAFLGRYVDTYGFGGHKPETFKRLDELNERIHSVAFHLTREEAGGFPHEQYQTVFFDLTNPALRHYKEMEKDLRTTIHTGDEVEASIVLTQVLRLQQITGGFLPVIDPEDDQLENVPLGNDRIKALSGIVDEYPKTEPLVIFVRFRYELEAVIELMRKMRRTVTYIAGGMKNGERDTNKLKFQNGRVDTCVVQIRAGGIAIELSRARTAIFYSLTHSFIDHEQAKARIIARNGGTVSLLYLAARHTVDLAVIEAVREKQDLAKKILKKIQE